MFSPSFFPQSSAGQQLYEAITQDEQQIREKSNKRSTKDLIEQLKQAQFHATGEPPRELTPEEQQKGQKRCLRCKKKYVDVATECSYHTGYYSHNETKMVNSAFGKRTGWSCCRYLSTGEINVKSLSKDSVGCRSLPEHEEDVLYTNTILRFEYSPSSLQQYELKMKQQEDD